MLTDRVAFVLIERGRQQHPRPDRVSRELPHYGSASEAMILTQPVSPADFRLVIIEIEIEIEKRQRDPVHVDLLTRNQLLERARREAVMKLGELIRHAAAECFGHLRFPSGVMGITDGP